MTGIWLCLGGPGWRELSNHIFCMNLAGVILSVSLAFLQKRAFLLAAPGLQENPYCSQSCSGILVLNSSPDQA